MLRNSVKSFGSWAKPAAKDFRGGNEITAYMGVTDGRRSMSTWAKPAAKDFRGGNEITAYMGVTDGRK